MNSDQLAKVIEALLFAADKPVPLSRFLQLLPEVKLAQIEEVVNQLNEHYQEHAFVIIKVAGGYQIVTRSEYHEWIQRLYAARTRPRLSQPALEALAVIAYKQPVSRVEIEAIRGVNSDGVLGTLLERNLIAIRGRAETVGRPLLYGTTEEFLRNFGLNELAELPRPEEVQALLKKRENENQAAAEHTDSEPLKDDAT